MIGALVETRIAGIPCIVRVLTWEYDPPCCTLEYDVLDRRGKPASWLDRKITGKDEDQIQDDVYREWKRYGNL
jgi:hypothetical protein